MGELLGLPEWLAVLLFVVSGLAIWVVIGFVVLRRAHRRLVAKRPNPTREEFIALMAPEVSGAAAEFLWDRALFYVAPLITPHPDDRLGDDLRIDDDDWSMEWPVDWAEQQGFHHSNLPEWPSDWPPTIRNFGRWLSMGPV